MTTEYPVEIEVSSPLRFDRLQILLRIVLTVVLGWIGITAGWLVFVLYGALPLIAAISISARGSARYREEVAPRMVPVLEWLLQLAAFMTLLVDRFPAGGDQPTRVHLRFTGIPTAGSALARLVTSIPSGLVLLCLWFVSSLLWLVAAVIVLVGAEMPRPILAFQRGVLRWNARLVAYHASWVEEYPPFALDTSAGGATPPLATSHAQ